MIKRDKVIMKNLPTNRMLVDLMTNPKPRDILIPILKTQDYVEYDLKYFCFDLTF